MPQNSSRTTYLRNGILYHHIICVLSKEEADVIQEQEATDQEVKAAVAEAEHFQKQEKDPSHETIINQEQENMEELSEGEGEHIVPEEEVVPEDQP
ncbi:hypothetical protein AgCh_031044 [Apium graveolens]